MCSIAMSNEKNAYSTLSDLIGSKETLRLTVEWSAVYKICELAKGRTATILWSWKNLQILRDSTWSQIVIDVTWCDGEKFSKPLPSYFDNRPDLSGHPKAANEGHLKGSSAILVEDHGERSVEAIWLWSKLRTRVRRRAKLALPYICRLRSLSRCTCPSTCPLLQVWRMPAKTAA
jgi:hypothetical protein